MKKREYACVTATKKGERWLKGGHPWLYESDIDGISGKYTSLECAAVIAVNYPRVEREYLAKASVELLTRNMRFVRLVPDGVKVK